VGVYVQVREACMQTCQRSFSLVIREMCLRFRKVSHEMHLSNDKQEAGQTYLGICRPHRQRRHKHASVDPRDAP
jgi:hypothetical protein